MNITDSDIKKFQVLYVKYFGKKLDVSVARTELSALVRQMEIVYQPITQTQFDELLIKDVNEYSIHDETKVF